MEVKNEAVSVVLEAIHFWHMPMNNNCAPID